MPEIEIALDYDTEPDCSSSEPHSRVEVRTADTHTIAVDRSAALSARQEQDRLADALSQNTEDIEPIARELFELLQQVSEEQLVSQPIDAFFRLARGVVARRQTNATVECRSSNMERFMSELPDRSRRVLTLDLAGLDYRQIGAQLEMTPEAAKDILVSVYVHLHSLARDAML